MQPIVADRQGALPQYGIHRKPGVEVREKITTARRLELQRLPKRITIDGDEQQVVHAGKMTPGGFTALRGG